MREQKAFDTGVAAGFFLALAGWAGNWLITPNESSGRNAAAAYACDRPGARLSCHCAFSILRETASSFLLACGLTNVAADKRSL
jgi:hypothetical protein